MGTIIAPDERTCERCGRHDVWDEEDSVWKIARDEDGEKQAGSPHCLHEWDITGNFNPLDAEG